MVEETVSMGTDVAFTVRRAGEVIEERRIVDDTEVDPEMYAFLTSLFDNPEEDPVLTYFVESLIELIDKEEE